MKSWNRLKDKALNDDFDPSSVSSEDISLAIEDYRAETGSDYLSSVVVMIDEMQFEYGFMKSRLSDTIKEMIYSEAENRNIIRRGEKKREKVIDISELMG